MWRWVKHSACALVGGSLSVVAGCVAYYLANVRLNPPVGTYIALMGLTAAIVSLFRINKAEKFAWICFMTVLMVAEIRNLYVADADQTAKFNKISDSLEATKRGLDATANGIAATASAIRHDTDKNDEHYSATMSEANEAISQITGGASFSYVTITQDGSGFVIARKGDYPLYEVSIDMIGYVDKLERRLDNGTFPAYVSQPWFRYDFSPFVELNYFITFTGRNGAWWETLQLRKAGDRWASAVKVERLVTMAHNRIRLGGPLRTKTLFVWVDPSYPKPNGAMQWCKFIFEKPQSETNPCITSVVH